MSSREGFYLPHLALTKTILVDGDETRKPMRGTLMTSRMRSLETWAAMSLLIMLFLHSLDSEVAHSASLNSMDIYLTGPRLATDGARSPGGLRVSDARSQSNLLHNGSFEISAPQYVGPYLSLYAGDTRIPGWTIGLEGIDLVHNFGFRPPDRYLAFDGRYYVDLQGSSEDDNTPGSIRQSFLAVPGQKYLVQFWIAARGGPNNPVKALFYIESGSEFVVSDELEKYWFPSDYQLTGWEYRSYVFTASSEWHSIVFESLLLTGDGGVGIDKVSITPVPLPASVLLFFVSLFLIHVRNLWRSLFGA